jgi:hypothetical protein
MVSMSSLSNIDINAYSWFAFTDQKQPFKTEVRVESGYVDFLGCDFFEIDSGTIICFKNKLYEGFHDIRITGQKVEFIQIVSDRKALDFVLNETTKDGYNFYLFLDSKVQENVNVADESYNIEALGIKDDFVRCDYRKMGGSSFYEPQTGYNIISISYVFSLTGIGHIIRIGTSNTGNLNANTPGEYCAAKTLTGMMKVLHEWSVVSKEPFSNQQEIAKSAALFLETMALDNEVMSEIISSTGDMALARYIRGDLDRSDEIENRGKYEMPESFSNYIKRHYSYPSLYELQESLDLDIFDDALIDNHLKHFESLIFNYFYEQGIDIESYTGLDQIYQLDTTPGYIKKYITQYKKVRDINL